MLDDLASDVKMASQVTLAKGTSTSTNLNCFCPSTYKAGEDGRMNERPGEVQYITSYDKSHIIHVWCLNDYDADESETVRAQSVRNSLMASQSVP